MKNCDSSLTAQLVVAVIGAVITGGSALVRFGQLVVSSVIFSKATRAQDYSTNKLDEEDEADFNGNKKKHDRKVDDNSGKVIFENNFKQQCLFVIAKAYSSSKMSLLTST